MSICFAVFRREVWIEIPILRRSSRAKLCFWRYPFPFLGGCAKLAARKTQWSSPSICDMGFPTFGVTVTIVHSLVMTRHGSSEPWNTASVLNGRVSRISKNTSEISVSWRLSHLYFLAKSWTPHFCGLSPQSWLISFFPSPITHQAFTWPNHIAVFVHLLTMSESIPTRNQHCW